LGQEHACEVISGQAHLFGVLDSLATKQGFPVTGAMSQSNVLREEYGLALRPAPQPNNGTFATALATRTMEDIEKTAVAMFIISVCDIFPLPSASYTCRGARS